MSGQFSFLRLMSLKPVSPASNNVPAPRRVSMTQVVTTENAAAYRRAYEAATGSPMDSTMLRAEGIQAGFGLPGWVGLSTPMVTPGRNNG